MYWVSRHGWHFCVSCEAFCVGWPAGQPIFLSRGAGNNVGNAYVFSPDLLASLLEVLPAHSFRPHLEALGAHVNWLESHAK